MKKTSYVDSQALAKAFSIGDTVLFPIFTRGSNYAPTIGKVTAVLPQIGFVDVETPFGSVRMAPEDLIKTTSEDASYLQDTSYSSYDHDKARKIASRYLESEFTSVCEAGYTSQALRITEEDAYKAVKASKPTLSPDLIEQALRVAYTEPAITKTALYWRAKGRRYMPSVKEVACGTFSCPNCRNCLEQTHYKKNTKLYVCRECLFTIRPGDLLSPGQIVEDLDDLKPLKTPIDFFSPNDPLLKHFKSK